VRGALEPAVLDVPGDPRRAAVRRAPALRGDDLAHQLQDVGAGVVAQDAVLRGDQLEQLLLVGDGDLGQAPVVVRPRLGLGHARRREEPLDLRHAELLPQLARGVVVRLGDHGLGESVLTVGQIPVVLLRVPQQRGEHGHLDHARGVVGRGGAQGARGVGRTVVEPDGDRAGAVGDGGRDVPLEFVGEARLGGRAADGRCGGRGSRSGGDDAGGQRTGRDPFRVSEYPPCHAQLTLEGRGTVVRMRNGCTSRYSTRGDFTGSSQVRHSRRPRRICTMPG